MLPITKLPFRLTLCCRLFPLTVTQCFCCSSLGPYPNRYHFLSLTAAPSVLLVLASFSFIHCRSFTPYYSHFIRFFSGPFTSYQVPQPLCGCVVLHSSSSPLGNARLEILPARITPPASHQVTKHLHDSTSCICNKSQWCVNLGLGFDTFVQLG